MLKGSRRLSSSSSDDVDTKKKKNLNMRKQRFKSRARQVSSSSSEHEEEKHVKATKKSHDKYSKFPKPPTNPKKNTLRAGQTNTHLNNPKNAPIRAKIQMSS